jgi:UDP-3-O-[3-hydroxymyristoyl] N-acetylglucosamine deacetylase
VGSSVALRGVALHRGGPAEVRLAAAPGPLVLAQRGVEARLDALRPVRTDRGVTVASEDGRVRVDLIEHLLAAIGGLGIGGGLRIETDDDELPLLDGSARPFVEALRGLDIPRTGPLLRVTRAATLEHERSVYRFTPGAEIQVRVEIAFPAPVGEQRAAWDGDAEDFATRIAPARTFGWARELDALRAAGRAAGVSLESVLVLDERGAVAGCSPSGPEEPARHKLLDLVGDLALHGGPPLGVVDAFAPGHTATHAVVARALASGVLARDTRAEARR